MSMFAKAERRKAKARVALCGPSGSGKSLSALMMAVGLAPEGRIAAIDTEHQSLALYSDRYAFDVAILEAPFSPERYIEVIHGAEKEGYDVILIDSLTHEWIGPGGILDIHGKMPGNSFANWKTVGPRHDALIQAILASPAHIIATMRTKTGYVQTQDRDGKQKIEKTGMEIQQRDGVDYEFTVVFDLSQEHVASPGKDRTGLFDGRYEIITPEYGDRLRKWLESGTNTAPPKPVETHEAPATQQPEPTRTRAQVLAACQRLVADDLRLSVPAYKKLVAEYNNAEGAHASKLAELSDEDLDAIELRLRGMVANAGEAGGEG